MIELGHGGNSRRDLLKVGLLGFGGLSLADVLGARAAPGAGSLDTSVILLYLLGGPSHLETYDLKPQAPVEYRSVFRPISTTVPGIDLCEHFPLQAQLADRFALVRSLHHDVDIHNDGSITVLTGKKPSVPDPSSQAVSEHPDFAMVAGKMLGPHRHAMPRYVAVPTQLPMLRTAYLGREHQAFAATDPSVPEFVPPYLRLTSGLSEQRLADRRGLLQQFDSLRQSLEAGGTLDGLDKFHAQAMQMLTRPQIAEAFDLAREAPQRRDRYGRHRWGQACLLARRLAEAGTSVISLTINTPADGPLFTNWDDHPDNAMRQGHFADFMARRLPYLDQALSALIEDIYNRGLDRRVLVVAMGEFGRTPRISYRTVTGSTGRNHWPQAYSALISGGGFRMGQAIGATNSLGEYPSQRPLTPQDLLATIYRHLGVDYRQHLVDFSGRPIPILSSGEPIRELIA